MDSNVALTPKAGELQAKAVRLLAEAESLTISTADEYQFAGSLIPPIGALLKAMDTERMAQTRPLDTQKRAIMDAYADASAPAQNAERIIKRAMLQYRQAEEQRRREEQRIANEQAEKERQRLERLAEKAEARGDSEKAETFEARADAVMPAAVAVADVPKVEGVATRKVWRFTVEDASQLPRNYLIADVDAIGKVVRALKDRHGIPGVAAWEEETIARTGR